MKCLWTKSLSLALLLSVSCFGATGALAFSTPPPADQPQPQPQPTQTVLPIQLYPASGFYDNEAGSPVFQLITAAKQTLDIEIYTMTDPGFRSALRAAIARGIK